MPGLTLRSEDILVNCMDIVWYVDNDEDGFGDATTFSNDCMPPVGYILNNTDCDDSRDDVYPGAPVPIIDIDYNCDGFILDVSDNTSASDILIFPNPTHSILNLEFSSAQLSDYSVRIFSLTGEIMDIFNFGKNIKNVESKSVICQEEYTF